MTDWETINENIRRAMETLHEAHRASHQAEDNLSPETLSAFQEKLRQLRDELAALEWLEQHPGSMEMDKLNELVRQWFIGRGAEYRRSPKIPRNE
ncbi:MAG: hypothetical protein D6755_08540 [Anaerolineae bacterium]|nr:MAG: hypothetical protein D6755_08540 [Anaerolineae bacterium]